MIDDALADMHLAVAELLDRMVIADLARSCREDMDDVDVLAAIARFHALREEGDAPAGAVKVLQ
jgi:hypothetical protein